MWRNRLTSVQTYASRPLLVVSSHSILNLAVSFNPGHPYCAPVHSLFPDYLNVLVFTNNANPNPNPGWRVIKFRGNYDLTLILTITPSVGMKSFHEDHTRTSTDLGADSIAPIAMIPGIGRKAEMDLTLTSTLVGE